MLTERDGPLVPGRSGADKRWRSSRLDGAVDLALRPELAHLTNPAGVRARLDTQHAVVVFGLWSVLG